MAKRPSNLPEDGSLVEATSATTRDSDRAPTRVLGPLATRWVEGMDYWHTSVAGVAVEPDSVIPAARIDLTRLLGASRVPDVVVTFPESGIRASIARYQRDETRADLAVPRFSSCWAPNKPALLAGDRRTWAEFVLVDLLGAAGWDARWIKNWAGGREFCIEPGVARPLAPAARRLFDAIHARKDRLRGAGSWDIFATRGDEVLLLESKKARSGDKLNSNQLGWLEAAVECGIPTTRFAIVEYNVRPTVVAQ